MSADILPFPSRQPSAMATTTVRAAPGDIIVTCINATIGLWGAWPIDAVDDDGVVVMIVSRSGQRIAAERVSCEPLTFGLAAADHDELAFRALRWRTWPSYSAALMDFAEIQMKALG